MCLSYLSHVFGKCTSVSLAQNFKYHSSSLVEVNQSKVLLLKDTLAFLSPKWNDCNFGVPTKGDQHDFKTHAYIKGYAMKANTTFGTYNDWYSVAVEGNSSDIGLSAHIINSQSLNQGIKKNTYFLRSSIHLMGGCFQQGHHSVGCKSHCCSCLTDSSNCYDIDSLFVQEPEQL